MGRRALFVQDEEVKKSFLKAIELGMSITAACDYAGMSPEAFYQYQRKAERDEAAGKTSRGSIYVKFINDFKKSRAKFKMRHIARITQASDDGSWQASAWLLERRCPEEFAQRQQVDFGDDSRITVVTEVPKEDD